MWLNKLVLRFAMEIKILPMVNPFVFFLTLLCLTVHAEEPSPQTYAAFQVEGMHKTLVVVKDTTRRDPYRVYLGVPDDWAEYPVQQNSVLGNTALVLVLWREGSKVGVLYLGEDNQTFHFKGKSWHLSSLYPETFAASIESFFVSPDRHASPREIIHRVNDRMILSWCNDTRPKVRPCPNLVELTSIPYSEYVASITELLSLRKEDLNLLEIQKQISQLTKVIEDATHHLSTINPNAEETNSLPFIAARIKYLEAQTRTKDLTLQLKGLERRRALSTIFSRLDNGEELRNIANGADFVTLRSPLVAQYIVANIRVEANSVTYVRAMDANACHDDEFPFSGELIKQAVERGEVSSGQLCRAILRRPGLKETIGDSRNPDKLFWFSIEITRDQLVSHTLKYCSASNGGERTLHATFRDLKDFPEISRYEMALLCLPKTIRKILSAQAN
jgi:hypothetical protein